MELDPIVLLAYVSVSLNILTLLAAVVVYAVFRTRKHRQRRQGGGVTTAAPPDTPLEPVFLRPHRPRSSGDRLVPLAPSVEANASTSNP